MSHTSGPWHINRDEEHIGILRIEDKAAILAYIDQGTAVGLDAEDEANARLIVASPKLIAACKEAENTFAEYGERAGFPDGAPECWAAIEALRAVISVAEGRDGAA